MAGKELLAWDPWASLLTSAPWPDLDDLSCHQDIRLPSVAHNRPPAAARAHAAHTAPEGTTDASATERPVMGGHDRTQPRCKAVYRQAARARYSRRGTMTQRVPELPHLGNRIALRAVPAHTACWAAGRAERSFLRQARLGQLILSPPHRLSRELAVAGVCRWSRGLPRGCRSDPHQGRSGRLEATTAQLASETAAGAIPGDHWRPGP